MGFWLLFPFLLVRMGLLGLLDRDALARAAHYAPMAGRWERAALAMYQLSQIGILVYLCFLPIGFAPGPLLYAGGGLYLAGMVLLAATVVQFARPAEGGMHQGGVYRLSRNPMYVAYFLVFLGCALLCRSGVLGVLVLVFQLSTHPLILAEERWCLARFGEVYAGYMRRVRRYL